MGQTRACRLPRAALLYNRQMLISISGFCGQLLRFTCSVYQDQCTVSAFRNAVVPASSAAKSKSHGELIFCGCLIFFPAASAKRRYKGQATSGAIRLAWSCTKTTALASTASPIEHVEVCCHVEVSPTAIALPASACSCRPKINTNLSHADNVFLRPKHHGFCNSCGNTGRMLQSNVCSEQYFA